MGKINQILKIYTFMYACHKSDWDRIVNNEDMIHWLMNMVWSGTIVDIIRLGPDY